MMRRPGLLALWLLVVVAAPGVAQQRSDSLMAGELPLDLGRLRQDDIALSWNRASLAIRFVPLDERVIRLLAPDGARSLHSLLESERPQIDSVMAARGLRNPGIALVTFHALAPGTRFDPQLLTISVRGQLWRSVAVVPLSVAFSNDQLDVRSAAIGLVLFDHEIPVRESFVVSYAEANSADWGQRLTRLDTERSRILATIRSAADSIKQR
jgi:hypothetical protein